MNYTPIVLFTYNRIDELQLTISALQQNVLAKESTLTIYSDAPKTNHDIAKVEKVRAFLKTVDGFKSVTIIEREKNAGLARSIVEGVTEVLTRYDKVIVLEDDLLTSSNFLLYMNEALNFYEINDNIFSISGYTSPLKSLKKHTKDTYISIRPSSWGWGTWKDQWENIDWNISDYDDFVKDKKQMKAFNQGGEDLTRMLKHYKQRKNNSWAIRWAYAMFKCNKYSINPTVSKVQNIGFGKDATHCKGINIYKTDLDIDANNTFDFLTDIKPDLEILKEFRYQYSFKNKLIKKVSLPIMRIFNEKS